MSTMLTIDLATAIAQSRATDAQRVIAGNHLAAARKRRRRNADAARRISLMRLVTT